MNQLTIPMDATPSFAADDYVVSDSNRDAYQMITSWPNWPSHAVWLHGPASSGKTHLASIWSNHAHAQAIHIAQLDALDPLLSSEQHCFVMDELTALNMSQQEGLFHLLNHVKHVGGSLLLIAAQEPKQFPTELADLSSRINALPVVSLPEPDDALIKAVWFKLFADRQLQVDPSVIDYLLQRYTRSFEAIHRLTEQLDCAALVQKRAITIPFVKTLLAGKS